MNRKNCPIKPHFATIALLVATAIWGVAGPVIKLTLEHLPVVTFLFLRFLIVCTVLLPIVIWEIKKNPVDKRDVPNLIILGLLSQTGILIVFWGYKLTNALDAALIGIAHPLMILVAGHYFYKEKISKLEKFGVALATLGTVIVILEPIISSQTLGQNSEKRVLGNILILLYQITWLLYIIWSRQVMGHKSIQVNKLEKWLHIRRMHKKYSPITLTLITFYIGLVSLIPLVILENVGVFGPEVFTTASLTTTAVLGLFYMALLSSIAAYVLFQWGYNKANVEDTAYLTYLGPIFAFPAAYLLLGEIPTTAILIGAAIIALGVMIAEKDKS